MMNTVNKLTVSLLVFSLALFSCKKSSTLYQEETQEETVIDDPDITDPDFATNTKDTTFTNAVLIKYADNAVTVTNPYINDGVTIAVNNFDVTVTSTNTSTEVNYVLSGTASSGSFKIYSDYKFGLGLNGVSITNLKGPAINIQSGKKVSVLLVGGTHNRLVDASTYNSVTEGEDAKGTLFSEGQLVFDGIGSLLLKGNYSHAICSDDYIRINSGTIKISGSVKDGIHANDYLRIDGGSLDITSTGDALECEDDYVLINSGNLTLNTTGEKSVGIKSEGTTTINNTANINITVSGKATKGIKTTGNLVVNSGKIDIISTGDAFYDTSDADISSSAGFKCDGNLLVENGTITINSSGSGGKGINIDGTIIINGGTITVNTTGGQFVYGKDDTAAKAIKSEGDFTVNGGNIVVKTSQKEAEGLESKTTLTINGGKVVVEAYDDGINATNHIAINGGAVYVYSTTNDAIDSNGTLTIAGGTIVAVGSTSPECGIDCDNNTFKITGGTIIGLGGSTSTPTSSVSTQRSLVYNISSSLSLNQILHIENTSGTSILDLKVPRAFSSRATLLLSNPNLLSGTSHNIYTGGSLSGGDDFYGLITGAAYTKGSSAATFTTSSMVTTIGTSGGR